MILDQEFGNNQSSTIVTRKKDIVTTLLDNVSYKVKPNYVPSTFAIMFVNFIKLVNGNKQESHPNPLMHYYMLDNGDDNSKEEIVNLCHRGSAKTTIFGEYFILFCAAHGGLPNFGEFNHGMYISDSIENGVKKMRKRIEIRLDSSEYLHQILDMSKVRLTDVRWEFWNKKGKGLVFGGYGIETKLRGGVELGERPAIGIFDDLMTDKNAKSPTIIKDIKDSIYGAIEYAMLPHKHKIIWNGTPFNANDPLYQAVNSDSWIANVYPVCEKFPCTREEFRGSWEERFSYDYVQKKYIKAKKNNVLNNFYRELMLRISSEDMKMVDTDLIKWFELPILLRNKGKYIFYITTDFATKADQKNDYSVIMVWALNSAGGWMLVDGLCEKQSMGANLKELFKFVRKYNPREVALEVSGQQGAYLSWIDEKMVEEDTYFDIARETNPDRKTYGNRGFNPITDKLDRFTQAAPIIEEGKLYIAKQLANSKLVIEFIEELDFATNTGLLAEHDDVIDAFSQLPLIDKVIPHANTFHHEEDMNEDLRINTVSKDKITRENPLQPSTEVFEYLNDELEVQNSLLSYLGEE